MVGDSLKYRMQKWIVSMMCHLLACQELAAGLKLFFFFSQDKIALLKVIVCIYSVPGIHFL